MTPLLARPFILLSCLLACSTVLLAQQPSTRTLPSSVEITGQVRYANGGAPVDKALVRLEAFGGGMIGQDMTDRTGKFHFSGLSPAQYVLSVHSPGFIDIRQQVDLQTSLKQYLQLQLVAERPEARLPTDSSKMVDAKIPVEAQKEFELGSTELIKEKKLESGVSHLEKAIKLYPQYLEAHLLLGNAYLETKQLDKAEHELRRTLEIAPKSPAAMFALGDLYRRQQKYTEAEKALQEGLKLDQKSYLGHFTLGQVYFAKNDLTKAGPEVGQALQLKPDFAEAYLLAGNIFLKARKPENALQMFEEYLHLAPKGDFAPQTREVTEKLKKALAEKK